MIKKILFCALFGIGCFCFGIMPLVHWIKKPELTQMQMINDNILIIIIGIALILLAGVFKD